MKITGIKTFVVNAKLRNWIFVRVETDQPGLYGLGEATLEFQTRAVVGARAASEWLQGRPPGNSMRWRLSLGCAQRSCLRAQP